MAIELLLLAAALVAVAGLAGWTLSRPAPATDAHQASLASAVARHARLRVTVAALGSIVIAAVLLIAGPLLANATARAVGPDGPTGLSFALTPLAVGLVFAIAFLIAERAWPRPTDAVRNATLRRRSITDFTPRWLPVLTVTWAAGLAVLLIWTGIAATGNTLMTAWAGDDGSFGWSSAGPFPGWGYGIPTLIVAALLMATAWLTLREIQRRPAMAGLDSPTDDGFRRSSARQVLGVTQAALGLTLSGNLYIVSNALRIVSYRPAALTLLLLSIAVGIAALVGLGLAARRR